MSVQRINIVSVSDRNDRWHGTQRGLVLFCICSTGELRRERMKNMKKYGFDFYEWQKDIVDTDILGEDMLTFSVLSAIVNQKCEKVFTDGKTVIICYSCSPYPVWVWVSSQAAGETVSRVAECLAEEFPPEKGYNYNLSYQLLEHLKKEKGWDKCTIETNMLTYRCDKALHPEKSCGGKARLATAGDIALLGEWNRQFCKEMENLELTPEVCRQKAEEKMAAGNLFLWEDEKGIPVAMAMKWSDSCYSKVMSVYTAPDKRRKGYALHLVYEITAGILEENRIPILYTDADYEASNACYKKIGYQQVGSLCTVR